MNNSKVPTTIVRALTPQVMGSENQPVRQSGIYHNLPQFDPSIKDLTAIVTGANGISGFHTCRALLDSPHRWKKIYAMSRRPPPEDMMNLLTPEQRGKIEHVASDFLKEPEELADAMKKAGVDEVDCECSQKSHVFSILQPPRICITAPAQFIVNEPRNIARD